MSQYLVFACLIFLLSVPPVFAHGHDELEVVLLVDRPLQPETYMYRVLKLALKNQDIPHTLKIEVIKASQPRRREIVAMSPKNYVIALGNRAEHERRLQPVHVPLQLGLGLGQRIILTRADLVDRLKRVKTLEDLSEFTIGQGLGWSDVKILREAGLTVQTPPKPTSIPKMIMQERLDLYPRGLFEIDLEYARYAPDNPGLVIEQNLVLSYPLVSFFYTRKGNDRLHNAIRQGMEKAYETGQLQDTIMTDPVFSKTLETIHLNKRIKIEIPVSNLSESTKTALERFPFIPGKPIGAPAR